MATVSPRKDPSKPKHRKNGKPGRRLSRLHKPDEMTLEDWQRELRRQFGAEQSFSLKNIGGHPVFSEFQVVNPQSKSVYRVAIRGTEPGDNYCSCPDFATNALGTCKHIEFALARLRARREGRRLLAQGFQPPYTEVFLQYGALREVRLRPGRECPVELARLAARYFDAEGRLLPDAANKFEQFMLKAASMNHEMRVYDDVLGFIAELRDAAQRRERVARLFPRGSRSAAFKDLLKMPLYDYQREGALFAVRAGRALIGDEMGLGKTVQAIAAAEIMARHFGVERVLVVCPTSLKHQWERELERFLDRSVQVIGGLRAVRQAQLAAASFFKITNYDTVHADLEAIRAWAPDLVILDEAQRIKNWSTRSAKSVKKIASPYAVVLTGTPLENRLEELVSIVQFVDQHRLGPTFRFLHDHQILEPGTGRVIGYRELDRVGQTLSPILIRRRKDEVLKQLPARLEKNFFVAMTREQMEHHDENRTTVARLVLKWRKHKFLSEADQLRLRIALQNMRMSCDSTYLLDQKTDFGVKADELATLLEEIYERAEAKVVIFSQWLRMHEVLLRRFEKRRWDHVLFHGGVESGKRRDLVDRFRQDPGCRAFLATDAGGVGLNLQHANVIVNIDLPWNPAVLEQRIGRVHRIGQKQPVQVFNFVSQGTIEEGMLSVLSFKKSLFSGVLDGGEKEVFLGGSRLSRFLETVDKVTDSIPRQVEEARETTARDGEVETAADSADDTERPNASSTYAAPTTTNPLAGLLQTGMAFLEQLAAASQPGARAGNVLSGGGTAEGVAGSPVEFSRDEATGRPYVKLQLPEPEVLDRAFEGLRALLGGLR